MFLWYYCPLLLLLIHSLYILHTNKTTRFIIMDIAVNGQRWRLFRLLSNVNTKYDEKIWNGRETYIHVHKRPIRLYKGRNRLHLKKKNVYGYCVFSFRARCKWYFVIVWRRLQVFFSSDDFAISIFRFSLISTFDFNHFFYVLITCYLPWYDICQ